MKRVASVFVSCVLAAFSLCGYAQPAGRIDLLVKTYSSPVPASLLGEWEYSDDSFVFMGKQGPTPSKVSVERLMSDMGIKKGNFSVVFHDGQKCTFRVGEKEFRMDYSINPETREFKATRSHISMRGYILDDSGDMCLIFSRPNLFFILRILCSGDERKSIRPLGDLLDITSDLTVGIEFAHFQ